MAVHFSSMLNLGSWPLLRIIKPHNQVSIRKSQRHGGWLRSKSWDCELCALVYLCVPMSMRTLIGQRGMAAANA